MFSFFGIKRRLMDGSAHRWEGPDELEPFGGQSERLGSHRLGKGGGHRQKRGFVRHAVLDLLTEQPRHGYDIIKELEQRYAGFYRPSAGSIYPVLQALEEEGQLTSQEQDGKKVYTLTESGQKLVEEHRQHHQLIGGEQSTLTPPSIERSSHPQSQSETRSDIPAIKQSTIALMETIRYVAHFGTPTQIKELKKIIEATSRQIHALLAQETQETDES